MKAIQIHPEDQVAVALEPLNLGDIAAGVAVLEAIPAGHKVALTAIARGQAVIKYGHSIGRATRDILPGQWVHSHNLTTGLEEQPRWRYEPQSWPLPPGDFAFQGYLRENGSAGIRNEVWILPTVGCVNHTARRLAERARGLYGDRVDGIWAFSHPYGCSQLGEDGLRTRKTLAALARHPNAAGVLVLGLGCETNAIDALEKEIGPTDKNKVAFLRCQDFEDEEEAALAALDRLTARAAEQRRQTLPASKLVIGLKCGGSDGFSGITANPLLGEVSQGLTAAGGCAVMTEVPEMFGAEQTLLNRCVDRTVFDRAAAMIQGFRDYYRAHGQPIYENPSPGNKDGGITTLEEKSLGCVQKGGRAPITQVLEFDQQAHGPGLALTPGPGNDLCSVTQLACAGAQLIVFTTGRGTPLCGPVPTLKIATNSALAQKKKAWIDFNAGALLEGESMRCLCQRLTDLIRATAGGGQTRGELHGYREIAIFKDGVTL